ncbi:MAG: energy transducer TonB [Planctomycetota bacterium]
MLSTPIVAFIKPEPIDMDIEERVNDMVVTPITPEILPDVICIRLESTESSESRIIPQASTADYSTSAHLKPNAEGRNRKPPYPELARRLGQEGLVVLLVEVDGNGRVSDITLKQSSGYKLLDDAALLCVKSWLFNPATKNGKPVVSKIEIPIRYKLS